jgi:Fur family transcriptional regulator, ferric uptake regulator
MAKGKSAKAEVSDQAAISNQEVAQKQDRLALYMEEKGLRSTAQRRLVTDVFFRAEGHFSIEDLLAMVRAQDPKVGYATVYRTLKLLKECGLANERQFKDGITRFEVAHEHHHDHLICVDCNLIVEFEDPKIERLQEQLANEHGFALVLAGRDGVDRRGAAGLVIEHLIRAIGTAFDTVRALTDEVTRLTDAALADNDAVVVAHDVKRLDIAV